MNFNDIFNDRTINIFTDGSIYHTKGNPGIPGNEAISCPGALIVRCDQYGVLDSKDYYDTIVRNGTNNIAELGAIELGILRACAIPDIHSYTVNLFSDSLGCINSLRTWIHNWRNCLHNGLMYSSSGEPVKNQQHILAIVDLIVRNNLRINLFHQKGHVNNTTKSLDNALRVFKNSNCVNDVDYTIITTISLFNNFVDLRTKDTLRHFTSTTDIQPIDLQDAIMLNIESIDFTNYRQLTRNSYMKKGRR